MFDSFQVLLDLGSSFGVWSLPFLKHLEKNGLVGKVMAIDAHLLSCQDLFKNARFNLLDTENLMILNCAIGLENGWTTLYAPKYASNLGATVTKNPTGRLFNQVTQIPRISVNFFIESFKPDPVKIDIEGLDLQMAKKVKNSVHKVKVLAIEVTPNNLKSGGDDLLSELLASFPFAIVIRKEDENEKTDFLIYRSLEDILSICKK